jgi:hypothetical protein
VSQSDWQYVSDRDGEPRDLDAAGVVELTRLLRTSHGSDELANWPSDTRIICRRERPSAGAQLCALEEADGWRYQLFATNTARGQLAFLEAGHRAHARVEDYLRCGKNTGLDHLPSTSMTIKAAWCVAATIGCDLLSWLRLLGLADTLADAEPKALRYRILHTAAYILDHPIGSSRRHSGAVCVLTCGSSHLCTVRVQWSLPAILRMATDKEL